MTRAVVLTIATLGFVYVGLCVALFCFQRNLIFVADKTDLAPADAGLPGAEVHRLTAADGVSITSWLLKADSRRLAIYFHGNGGALASRTERIQELADLGLSVLAVEYRGYGGSDGYPSEAGLRLDAEAAYAFALRLGFEPSRLVLYGESLGAAVAVALASQHQVAGLILDAPFSSLVDIAADRYWMFPTRLLLRDRFPSDRLIGQIEAPILILHGTDDQVVPIRYGQRLFERARKGTVFFPVDGGDHVVFGGEPAQERTKTWLAKLFAS